jgi:23S rRNA (cytidine1920-2'-O)/16S rRNA (cytidine1409-2'-O)-methyltransferase
MKKKRLDEILIERGIAKDKSDAAIKILAGDVLIKGQKAIAPSQMYPADAEIELRTAPQYVGRGGEKLIHALREFSLDVRGKTCLDIGSATGGFVDVMLQNGAAKVYAVDTAKGKLDLKLREDPRVEVMEGVNILHTQLPEKVDFISIDVSLTSLRNVFPRLKAFLKEGGEIASLFKPQYEVLDKGALRHGILESDAVREETLNSFLTWLSQHGWMVLGKTTSPIKGSEGNTEYLLHVKAE